MKTERSYGIEEKIPIKRLKRLYDTAFDDTDEKDRLLDNPFLDPVYFERNKARLDDITLREPANSLGLDVTNIDLSSDAVWNQPMNLDDPEIVRQLEELYSQDTTVTRSNLSDIAAEYLNVPFDKTAEHEISRKVSPFPNLENQHSTDNNESGQPSIPNATESSTLITSGSSGHMALYESFKVNIRFSNV